MHYGAFLHLERLRLPPVGKRLLQVTGPQADTPSTPAPFLVKGRHPALPSEGCFCGNIAGTLYSAPPMSGPLSRSGRVERGLGRAKMRLEKAERPPGDGGCPQFTSLSETINGTSILMRVGTFRWLI